MNFSSQLRGQEGTMGDIGGEVNKTISINIKE